jgi:2-amino-1-hydroxyethylphosphonate dioxygenase (glycine-forming)
MEKSSLAAMVPIISWPRTIGERVGRRPRTVWISLAQMVARLMRTSVSPGARGWTGQCSNSKGWPGWRKTAAVAIMPTHRIARYGVGMESTRAEMVVREINELFEKKARSGYFGEAVSKLQHAEQAAALAQRAGADEETILAALLHDVGHLLEGGEEDAEVGVIDHDHLAAAWLRERGFGERLIALVEGHVDAKRYLVATHPDYDAKLSDASRRTLELQGGPMNASEVAVFGGDALLKEKLRLRSWDEQAKDPEARVAAFGTYAGMMRRYLESSLN